jgi:hypothetical protein
MKSINTLIPDIYGLMRKRDGWFTEELAQALSKDIAKRLQTSLNRSEDKGTLRLSKMGPVCPRALWYSYHHPEMAEPLPPWAVIKFSYGHILEAQAIVFAKAAGHEVTGEQDELRVDGIIGHRDCVLDGAICDIKSTSTFGFKKFDEGTLWQDDSFGYLEQLDGYICGSLEDPLVRIKDKGYILAIDKQLGHMALYEHKFREAHIRNRIAESKKIVLLSSPPACQCKSVKEGESGNLKLDVSGSYNSYKYACNPNLRTFLYAKGPVYFTRIVKRPAPHIVEVDKFGKIVYS